MAEKAPHAKATQAGRWTSDAAGNGHSPWCTSKSKIAMRRITGLVAAAGEGGGADEEGGAAAVGTAPPGGGADGSFCCWSAYDARPYTLRTYAAATATLFSRQKPCVPLSSCSLRTIPRGPAWCPGGRTGQNAFRTSPESTRSAAAHTAPAARSAASHDDADTAVSESSSLIAGGAAAGAGAPSVEAGCT